MDNMTLEEKMNAIINGSSEAALIAQATGSILNNSESKNISEKTTNKETTNINDDKVVDEIIPNTTESSTESEIISNEEEKDNDNNKDNIKVEETTNINDDMPIENAVKPEDVLPNLAAQAVKIMGAENAINSPEIQKEIISKLPSNNTTTTKTTTTKTTTEKIKRKKFSKKGNDPDALATELVSNFSSLSNEEKFDKLTRIIGKSASKIASDLGLTPGNRILMSVKGLRPLKEEQLTNVRNYFLSNKEIIERPSVKELITVDIFK